MSHPFFVAIFLGLRVVQTFSARRGLLRTDAGGLCGGWGLAGSAGRWVPQGGKPNEGSEGLDDHRVSCILGWTQGSDRNDSLEVGLFTHHLGGYNPFAEYHGHPSITSMQ